MTERLKVETKWSSLCWRHFQIHPCYNTEFASYQQQIHYSFIAGVQRQICISAIC